jgi:SAM-dependent methyltransferase
MEDYYRRRAEEYEQVYYRNDLVAQEEIRKIASTLKEKLKGRRVLEIACGTGYWTQVSSETAQNIVATDIAQEMLAIAKRKQYHSRIDSFLKDFHRVLQSGSMMLMADNVYVPGLGGKLVTREGDENTYKLRSLKDGSECLILKNYFAVDELTAIFKKYATKFGRENVFYGNRYWYVTYELK